MIRLLVCALLSTTLAAGCTRTRCEDYEPEPNAGSYRGGGTLGDERMRAVTVQATPKQVVLTYIDPKGAKIHATYRVLKKAKK